MPDNWALGAQHCDGLEGQSLHDGGGDGQAGAEISNEAMKTLLFKSITQKSKDFASWGF
jgi:prophage antirepressor-like protein